MHLTSRPYGVNAELAESRVPLISTTKIIDRLWGYKLTNAVAGPWEGLKIRGGRLVVIWWAKSAPAPVEIGLTGLPNSPCPFSIYGPE